MTFTSSRRIAKAYDRCDGITVGMGQVGFKGSVYKVTFTLTKGRKFMRIISAIR
jgi:hypothetical protein